MSEINENAQDLNEDIEEVVDDATVVTVPIDDSLTVSGEAADAKAVGDALALKADKSELAAAISVNGQTADNQGLILLSAENIPMDDSAGAQTVAEAITSGLEISADRVPVEPGSEITVADELARLDSEKGNVKAVNGNMPDSAGNVNLERVDMAGDLESSISQTSLQTYIVRTTGGSASIDSGDAWLMSVRGNSVKTGAVEEVLTATPSNQDLTVDINADTFKAAVSASTIMTITYSGSAWSTDLSTLGITVTGTPEANDTIEVVYVKEDRGTIVNASPAAFITTGWNLYNHSTQIARVVNYSDDYGYRIDGTYTSLKFSATQSGTQINLSVANNMITGFPTNWTDGYIWVTGGNNTDTAIYATWGDWSSGTTEEFAVYWQSQIDLSGVMNSYFPNGLLSVGAVYDEISLDIGQAVSRIERLEYNTANLIIAEESGRAYDTDENYIYLARAASDIAQYTYSISISGRYSANDHGLEMFSGTGVGVTARTTYGSSLKNKLERDVLTISQQSLSNPQKAQARNNIGAVADADAVHKTGDETVGGEKRFTEDVRVGGASRYKRVTFTQSNGNSCAHVYFDTGNATNQTLNRMGFTEFSPKSTADATNTGYYEMYNLPAPDKGLTANATYDILTSKTEPILYQPAALEHTFVVPSNSRNLVLFTADGVTYFWAGLVYGSSTGAVTVAQIYKGNNVTESHSTNSITFTLTSSMSCYLRCVRIRSNTSAIRNPS